MFCWISRTGTKKAHIRWTDERLGILGLLDADDRDLEGLSSGGGARSGAELGHGVASCP